MALKPVNSGEIDTELGDDLIFKPGTLGRFSCMVILTRLKAMGLQIRHTFR